jgi:transcriptional/translational regulatory protein YebC/TACO1
VPCDEALADSVLMLLDALEELDDVQNVYSNAELADGELES